MRAFLSLLLLLLSISKGFTQPSRYQISFPNAVHHEALVTATFTEIGTDTLELRMSRSSPGRYALHEFAKNVYGFQATDGKGNALKAHRPDPYSWKISGHHGIVNIQYTLFANRGDGTYSQIDETHAHLNIPATFIYAPILSGRPFEVSFVPREDLHWKVATQLQWLSGNTYKAPNLQYFMDSPTELSDYSSREFVIPSNGRDYTIQFVLHHQDNEDALDAYFDKVKKIVQQQMKVFGELPAFDHGRYTFLACYMPQISGDGMEHRNSTVVTSTQSLSEGGMEGNISTVSHEFFHAWNVERLRPKSLEPFNFKKANMSGELWFAEGFTSYYTDLILCRAGIISPEAYISGLNQGFNYVWNSPGRKFFNPIEMSYQAPFVDAATAIDPQNTVNTFISYYTYGKMLGLALDLSLRQNKLSLDGYMHLLWDTYGRKEIPYTIRDLQSSLGRYAGTDFSDQFFDNYIFGHGMPDYKSLFENMGVMLSPEPDDAYFGAVLTPDGGGGMRILNNTVIGGPAYIAGLENGDILVSLDGKILGKDTAFNDYLTTLNPGDSVIVGFKRRGQDRHTTLTVQANPVVTIQSIESVGGTPSAAALEARNEWLQQE